MNNKQKDTPVALVIIPVRDRDAHLKKLIPELKLYMSHSNIECYYFVIEQSDNLPFNKAYLINVAFDIATKTDINFNYCIFHDVDHLPVTPDYSFPESGAAQIVLHSGDTTWDDENHFGGVIAVTKQTYRRANGSSNGYWGWGSEDYDLQNRLEKSVINIERRHGIFKTLDHESAGWNGVDGNKLPFRNLRRLVAVGSGFIVTTNDGMNNLSYKILKSSKNNSIYRYKVELASSNDTFKYSRLLIFILIYTKVRIRFRYQSYTTH
ncbi:hypothetical protein KBF61_01370 [Candidatus Saccharibacteria bacterium]|jgi:hypothetical protein|nr:hypothetical protein [Candidatus Saccharibacteria bacterium]